MKGKFENTTPFLHQLSFVLIVWIMLGSIFMLDEAERQEKERREWEAYRADSLVTLLFAGDIMGHTPQYQVAYNPETGEYDY